MFNKKTVLGWVVAFAVVGLGALPTSGWAKTDAEIQREVEDILVERHPTATSETWRGMGPQAPRVMIRMYQSTTNTLHRIRLLEGLAWFDDESAVDFIKQQAQAVTNDVVRNTAIRSIGISQGESGVDFVSKFLDHASGSTRAAAAKTLKSIHAKSGDPKSKALVDKFMAEERNPSVLAEVRGELPRPSRGLSPVASSEERLDAAFEGKWKGYWLAPKAKGKLGIDEALVRLEIKDGRQLLGEVTVGRLSKKRSLTVDRAQGGGVKVSGVWRGKGKSEAKGALEWPAEVAFQAEVRQEAGAILLEARVPSLGGTLVVRKEPK